LVVRQHGYNSTEEDDDDDERENQHAYFFEDFDAGVFGPCVLGVDGVGGEGEAEK